MYDVQEKSTHGLINSRKTNNSQVRQLTNSPTHKLLLYINKVYIPVMLSMCKETQNFALRFDIFLKNTCVMLKNFITLHPLSGTKFSGSD